MPLPRADPQPAAHGSTTRVARATAVATSHTRATAGARHQHKPPRATAIPAPKPSQPPTYPMNASRPFPNYRAASLGLGKAVLCFVKKPLSRDPRAFIALKGDRMHIGEKMR